MSAPVAGGARPEVRPFKRGAIVVFAKPPRPGLVKTRMSPPLSLEEAAELYASLLDDVLATTAELAAELDLAPIVAVHPPDACAELVDRAPAGYRVMAQRGRDLSERMRWAMLEVAAGGASPILLRGSDCPVLGPQVARQALEALESSDLVLCPDRDGGYNLVGLRTAVSGLFQHPMSTASVLEDGWLRTGDMMRVGRWGMKYFGFSATSCSAFLIAPGLPSVPGVSTSSAPKIDSNCLRSKDIVSGIVRRSLYPLAAQTKAREIPVLPLVGSTITVSFLMSPLSSASTIMATPILSLTLAMGLKDSSLATTSAFAPSVMWFSLTSGVFPISSLESLAMPLVSFGISIVLYRSFSTFGVISDILYSSLLP